MREAATAGSSFGLVRRGCARQGQSMNANIRLRPGTRTATHRRRQRRADLERDRRRYAPRKRAGERRVKRSCYRAEGGANSTEAPQADHERWTASSEAWAPCATVIDGGFGTT